MPDGLRKVAAARKRKKAENSSPAMGSVPASTAVSQLDTKATTGQWAVMPHRQPMNVSLTPELASFVRAQVASGRYGSASEVVRASLRMMFDHAPDRLSSEVAPEGKKLA